MKISTKGRYALRLMIDLAQHYCDDFITLREISERQNISRNYLEQIVPLLNKSGFLQANRGYQGGYRLAKSADKYTVAEILLLTEGSLSPVVCLDQNPEDCINRENCLTFPVWLGLKEVIFNYLENITVQDIIDKKIKL